ncbi:hypothetical protein [Sphingomonas sp. Leaf25]|uniref:hypothetical protein n=1 Tax=Sphingomonas sp. Leaf25 TaxID=1735692 RepID=UPI0012E1F0F2|nr:hypothetical protein [Sphingomonas sp. Leaf25]
MRLFGKKERPHPLADMPVWIVPLDVRAGTEQLPTPLIGAYVQVFCRGDDPSTAAWAAIQAIEAMGYSVPEGPTTVNQMPAADYDMFVSSHWPEQRAAMPSQAEFYESMADYRTVFGPFGGYDTPSSSA